MPVPLEEWRQVVSATVAAAKAGDASARAWLAQYLVGKPGATAPAPLTVIVQQLSGRDPLVERLAKPHILRPGYCGCWQWTRDGETVASIQMRAEQDRVILTYRHRSGDGEWKDEHYAVRIVRTPCNLGGRRAWSICPAVGCGRRVAILYGGGIFACRRCYQLAYPSAREDVSDRIAGATARSDPQMCVLRGRYAA
jgi:hypothetical protein